MGTIADKLKNVRDSKADIKAAIESKLRDNLDIGNRFADYPAKINSIEPAVDGYLEIPEVIDAEFDINSQIKNFYIPDLSNVTSLKAAFENCKMLDIVIDLSKNMNNINLSRAFYKCYKLKDLYLSDGILDRATTSFDRVFGYCYKLPFKNITINNNKISNFYESFCNTQVETVDIDIPNMGICYKAFQDCINLKSINLHSCLKLSEGNHYSFFLGCTNLEEIYIDALPNIKIDLGFNYCPKLTKESLMRIMTALPNTTTKSLTLGTTNLSKLSEEEKAIAIDKGWTLL